MMSSDRRRNRLAFTSVELLVVIVIISILVALLWRDVSLDEVPEDNQANLEDTIRRAVELGINHIETPRGYGSSERQLGLVLPTLPRDEIIV